MVRHNTLPTGGAARGAGLHNIGALTLRLSVVVNNSAVSGFGGGGIYNEGFFVGGSTLMVSDSTISDNTIGSNGGGILNGGATTIINSTISDNTAIAGFGGGIANLHAGGNFTARLTAINSTISGNSRGTQGGGIVALALTMVHLNNVTVTNNTAGTSAAASRSGGGINYSDPSQEFTLQNTLIAGNRDVGLVPAPDCFAEAGNGTPVTSRGYNLIQDTTHCTILGDTTGNLTGVDPQLGLLLDNGGLTKTHALAVDSPALDAGNPAGPGGGGTACAALDQRGFNRLQDGDNDGIGRCDVGAFELSESAVGFSFSGIRPNAAGNSSAAYALLYGSGFARGMTARLRRAGAPDIVGAAVTVSPEGAVAATSFDLTGQTAGLWDVVVTNPGEPPIILPNGFTVEEGGTPQLWVDVLGPSRIRVGRPTRFTLLFGNRGNVDASGVPLILGIPRSMDFGLNFSFAPPPPQVGQVPTNWDAAAFNGLSQEHPDFTMIPLLLPVVPAGSTQVLEFTITAPQELDGQNFQILFGVKPPYFRPALDAQIVDEFIETARTYAEQQLGATIPPALVPAMKQYLTTQLQSEVTRGRDALIANVSANFEIYSLSHLLRDVAQFGVMQAAAQMSQTQSQGTGRLASLARVIIATVFELFAPNEVYANNCSEEGGKWKQCSGCLQPICCKSSICCALVSCPKPPPPPCAGESCKPGGSGGGSIIQSYDPNDKVGSRGAGLAQYLTGGEPLRYTVLFENLPTASAAAQEVVITDQLDGSKVDFATFSLGPISFSDKTVVPPPGLSQYSTSVDLRPANDLIVGINARLDKTTGLLTWRFTSIDPLTGQFTEDPLAGFLPPNVNPPEGDGSVVFTIKPKVTGTPICNQATIVFDTNDPIDTPQWCNSIDVTPPTSTVAALAATQTTTSFPVQWSGADAGAGVRDYTLWASVDGGPYQVALANTTDTSTLFTGEVGKQYAFYTIARDLVGNEEAPPAKPDATTQLVGDDQCPSDPQKTSPGLCDCGTPDTDSDGDGTPDCVEGCVADPAKTTAGVCGCGVSDADSDGDGTPNCQDQCPSDATKTQVGACGCGVSESSVGQACTTGQLGVCSAGTKVCAGGVVSCQAKLAPSAEVCDGLDNNCNGQSDEGLTVDGDQDGFTTPSSCTGSKNDCNDANRTIHPGAGEVCGDSVDQDCNGQDLPCPPAGSSLYLHATATTLFVNASAPTATVAKTKDSPIVTFANGNPWKEIGVWTAPPGQVSSVSALGNLRVWLGLKNSDDQGTQFDVKAEVRKNGARIGPLRR